MSYEQKYVLCFFGVLTALWVISGFVWLALTFASIPRPNSVSEIKARANRSSQWYLIPFADKTTKLWRYLAWLFGVLWLGLEFVRV